MSMSREWFRGTLLSVLFFALLTGGTPSMAAAEVQSVTSAHMSPHSCGEAGGSWIAKGNAANPNGYCTFDGLTWDEMVGTDEWCRLLNAGANIGAIDLGLMGAIGGFAVGGGPIGGFIGGLGGFGLGALGKLYVGYHCW